MENKRPIFIPPYPFPSEWTRIDALMNQYGERRAWAVLPVPTLNNVSTSIEKGETVESCEPLNEIEIGSAQLESTTHDDCDNEEDEFELKLNPLLVERLAATMERVRKRRRAAQVCTRKKKRSKKSKKKMQRVNEDENGIVSKKVR
jgi:hypothetical protein